jgi:hypothetical protein
MRIRYIVTRVSILLAACLLLACGPAPKIEPAPAATPETVAPADIERLSGLNRQAREAFQKGKGDAAAALIEQAEPIAKRILSVPEPGLAATEAASDLDQLYGDMLLSNNNVGWARMLYQKNLARWKYWKPPTPESAARLKQAQDSIAACDRRIATH